MRELLNIEPTAPKWRELADIHGIQESFPDGELWMAEIELFGEVEFDRGETEKEAVVALIHRLKLTGWETVSLSS